MDIITKTIFVSPLEVGNDQFGMADLKRAVVSKLDKDDIPIRFLVFRTHDLGYDCEVDVIRNSNITKDIFQYSPRQSENTDKFNIALMIPTGIGCALGGHAGDANALARAFASICDNLITHPNVVNAANYNEQTDNTLYIEGSAFTQLFMGQIGLQKVRSNKILLLVDKHEIPYFNEEIVNAASTARMMLGVECTVRVMQYPVTSKFTWSQAGRAAGSIEQLERLFDYIDIQASPFDAIALSTSVLMPSENYDLYFKTDKMAVNPIGGIEAMLTHAISHRYGVPCAHAPLMSQEVDDMNFGIVDPRKAAESSSVADIYCVLKGLHKSPRLVAPAGGLSNKDISCLVIPNKCVSLPVLAAFDQGIPVIAVRENTNIMQNDFDHYHFRNKKLHVVANYWEALAVAQCLKQGIDARTIRRPVEPTMVSDY